MDPCGVKRTKVWVIEIYFSDILVKEKKFSSSKRGIWVFWVPFNQVKMTRKWGEIQGKSELVQVSGEIRLSVFELSGFYYIILIILLSFILADGLLGLGILGGTALVVGGAAALLGMAFANRKWTFERH